MRLGTPCIGVCSTVYGDLVCRGCKRFAHEVIHWNAYSDEQRIRIHDRLRQLKSESVKHWLRVADAVELSLVAHALRVPLEQPVELVAFGVLKKCGMAPNLIGLEFVHLGGEIGPAAIVLHIEEEFYLRSKACYEHSFRALVQ